MINNCKFFIIISPIKRAFCLASITNAFKNRKNYHSSKIYFRTEKSRTVLRPSGFFQLNYFYCF